LTDLDYDPFSDKIFSLIVNRIEVNNLFPLKMAVELGWYIFPVTPNCKIPLAGTHGKNSSSNRIDVILDWIAQERPSEYMNFGINLEKSHLATLDVDIHGQNNGINMLGDMVNNGTVTLDELLTAYIQRTPSGGLHFIWRCDKPFKQKHDLGLDYLSKGCSTMCAGSSIDGRKYHVLGSLPKLANIGEFPSSLIHYKELYKEEERIERRSEMYKTKANIKHQSYTGSGRNNWLTGCAGRLIRCVEIQSERDLYDELLLLNRQLTPCLPNYEIACIAKSMMRYKT
jgi:hypothetical protein